MATIGSLIVKLTAKDGAFRAGIGRAASSVKGFAGTVARATKIIGGYGTAITAVAGGAGLTLLVKKQFELIDSTAKTADRLGLTTEALTGLRHAATLTGVAHQALDVGLQRLTRRLAEAAQGSGVAVGALQRLGLDAQKLAQMSPDAALAAIADAMQGIPSQAEKVALAFKLFDTEGVKLINTLAGGSEGLKNMMAAGAKTGAVFDRVLAAKVEAANDAIANLRLHFQGLAVQIAGELAPFVQALADHIVAIGFSGEDMATRVTRAFSGVITFAAKLADVALAIQIAWKFLQLGMSVIITGLVGFFLMLAEAGGKVLDFLGFEFHSDFLKGFREIAEGFKHTTEEIATELDSLVERPWPSDEAEKFLRNIQSAATEAAETVADTVKTVQEVSQATPIEPVKKEVEAVAEVAEEIEKDQREALAGPTAAVEGSAAAAAAIADFRNQGQTGTAQEKMQGTLERQEQLAQQMLDELKRFTQPLILKA